MKRIVLITLGTFFFSFLSSQNLYDKALYIAGKIDTGGCVSEKYFEGFLDSLEIIELRDKSDMEVCISMGSAELDSLEGKKKEISADLKNLKELKKESAETTEKISSKERELKEITNKIKLAKKNGKTEIDYPSKGFAENITGNSFLPSPSVLIDGTAQFLVDRTKQELNLAFIDKFRTAFEKNKEMKKLFPSVHSVVMNNDPFNYSIWTNQLKVAGRKDIQDLPHNFSIFIKSNDYYDLKGDEEELLETFIILSHTLQLQQSGLNTAMVMQQIEKEYGYDSSNTTGKDKVNKALSFFNALSVSLYRNNSQNYVKADSIINMNDCERAVFLKLFGLKNKELLENIHVSKGAESTPGKKLYSYFDSINLNDCGKSLDSELENIFIYASGLSTLYQSLSSSFKTLREDTISKQQRINSYKQLNNGLKNFYEIGFKLVNIKDRDALYDEDGYYLKYKPFVTNSTDLHNYLLDQKYTEALVSFNNIFVSSLNLYLKKREEDCGKFEISKTIEDVIYWGGFINEVATIDSAHQVKDLLEKYADPVGSYRIKRNSAFSVTLNSYPGFFLGVEKIMDDNNGDYALGSGLTVPIGFSFNWGGRNKSTDFEDFDYLNKNDQAKKYTGSSWGGYLTFVDIAAPFMYRWTEADSTKGLPDDLKWENIFSPGAYFCVGLPGSGLTLMLGGQLAPSLRDITKDGLEFRKDTWRGGFTLTYDIPVFTLYRKKY